jgi:hypothetical protein
MTLFSQRKGLTPIRTALQIDSMDAELRSRLWDIFVLIFISNPNEFEFFNPTGNSALEVLTRTLWHRFFKKPMDTIPGNWTSVYKVLRAFFFDCEWYQVYDFIEFVANTHSHESTSAYFMKDCNSVLEQELSGYRFVGRTITQITSTEEIAAIEEVSQLGGKFRPVSKHVEQSLRLLADKKNPNYSNSIKEAVSAVEAVCQIVGGSPKATLGDALKKMEGKVRIHPALRSAFEKLYGYTSDADGIRHALLEETDLGFVDAKFMLVSCSAFVNYVVAKSAQC